MGLADRMEDVPGDLDPPDFTVGTDCGRAAPSEWCFYPEPHEHGFACDRSCPCWESAGSTEPDQQDRSK